MLDFAPLLQQMAPWLPLTSLLLAVLVVRDLVAGMRHRPGSAIARKDPQ